MKPGDFKTKEEYNAYLSDPVRLGVLRHKTMIISTAIPIDFQLENGTLVAHYSKDVRQILEHLDRLLEAHTKKVYGGKDD